MNKKRKTCEPETTNPANKSAKIESSNKLKRKREQEDNNILNEIQQPTKMLTNSGGKRSTISTSGKKNGQQPVKKLAIKFKVKPTLPENYAESTWEVLKVAINAVHTKQAVGSCFEELYKCVEDLVDHQISETLYHQLEQEIEEHTKRELQKLTNAGENISSETFLVLMNNCWSDFCQQLLLIRQIFLVLDRKFALQRADIRTIWDLGLHLFSKHIASVPKVDEKLRKGLLSMIERDRNGETVDKMLLKNLLRMLSSLQMYENHFEVHFLAATEIFYERESKRYIEEFQVAEFLKHFENRIEEEIQRVVWYLDSATRKPLIHNVETIALAHHVDALIEKGFDSLMDGDKKDDLKRMYYLFLRVDGLGKLKDAWNGFIKKRGGEIVTDEQNDKTMIETLLQFKSRLDTILKGSFNGDDDFFSSLREAFEYFINLRQNTPAELLAKFVDSKLRIGKSMRALSDAELETLLDLVMEIFRFINGKDVFEAFYKKDLAKRLLLEKSASIDGEKAMIAKLKAECGANFTSKLEGMFKDIDLSKDIMQELKQTKDYEKTQRDGLDSKVFVLTTGYWPSYTAIKCNLPKELLDFQKMFEGFYLNKYQGRRLLWQHSLTQCTLKAIFPKGRKEVVVSLFQGLVLIIFNEEGQDQAPGQGQDQAPGQGQDQAPGQGQDQALGQGQWKSFNDILIATGLEVNELKRTLQSLACGKVRVLSKEPQGRQVAETDVFQINANFSAKPHRININASVQVKETKQEQKKTQENIFKDRQYQVDAAIVRIMKTRKTLSHNLLISELYNQLKFPLKASDMKKRIESLIEREYIERDSEDSNLYNYLA